MAEVTDVTATKKLQMQLGVPFFILTGFGVAVFIFGTIYFGTTQNSANQGVDPTPIAERLAEHIGERTAFYGSLVERAATIPQQDVFLKENDDALRELLSQNRNLLALVFFDETGIRITDLHKSRIPKSVLDRASEGANYLGVLQVRNAPHLQLLRGAGDTSSMLYRAVPQLNTQNELSGFVVGVIDSVWLDRLLESETASEALNVSILESRTGSAVLAKNTLSDVSATDRPPQETFIQLFESNRSEYGFETDQGRTVEGSWRNIPKTEWNIVIEGYGTSGGGGSIMIFAVGGVLILVFIAIAFMYISLFNRKLLKPLKRIERTLHYYRTGDYSEEVSVDTKNELAAIAQALNILARNVENNTSERVTQLKKVLERQNTDTKLLIEKDVELREKSQKLKELDAAKSMFVSVAAHQMRTPLAAVKWAIKLVMDGDVGPVNAEQKEYLNKGYTSTTRMIDLINDLLDVDKIESDKFTYEFKPESLFEIVQGIVDDLTPLSKEKGVHLVFEHEGPDIPKISADKVKLRNALQNLIDNAIKYTIGGGDVTVTLRLEADIVKLNIADTGIGIPVSEQDKVFGKFFRAKNAVRQQTDGSGLGLFIVKKIIEKHHGTVRFESKEKKGTTFFIELPTLKT